MKKPKVYISGPMSGIEDHNFPEFDRVAAILRDGGCDVVNPADISRNLEEWCKMRNMAPPTYDQYMAVDLDAMDECECVVYLKGWAGSEGAKRELDKSLAISLAQWVWDYDASDSHNTDGVKLVVECYRDANGGAK